MGQGDQPQHVGGWADVADAAVDGVEGGVGPATRRPDGCRWVLEWAAVKVRRSLTVDATEEGAQPRQAVHCADITVTFTVSAV